jgi:uncharacterized protein YgiM (DUF1202 family)
MIYTAVGETKQSHSSGLPSPSKTELQENGTMKAHFRFGLLLFLLVTSLALASPRPQAVAAAATGHESVVAALASSQSTAVVTTGALNVRSGPGLTFSRVTVIQQGHVVTLLGRNANASWAQVRTAAGVTGWVNASFIQPAVALTTLPVTDTTPVAPTAMVITGALNVRSGPGVGYAILHVVRHGDTVTLLGRNGAGSWAQARLATGQVGWLNAALIQPSVPITTLAVIEVAPGTALPLATVVTGALNVRSGPGVNFGVITALQSGQQAPLLGRDGTGAWVQIRLATWQAGWVHANYIQAPVAISSLPVVTTTGAAPAATATIATWALNVRTGPGVNFGIVTAVRQGQQVTLLGRNAAATWVQVRLATGQTGWVNAHFIQPSVGIGTLPVTG